LRFIYTAYFYDLCNYHGYIATVVQYNTHILVFKMKKSYVFGELWTEILCHTYFNIRLKTVA